MDVKETNNMKHKDVESYKKEVTSGENSDNVEKY